MQQSKPFSLTLNVTSGVKPPLAASDFSYLGSYVLTNGVGEGITFGAPLAHWYVGGQLRFLVSGYNSVNVPATHDLYEFAVPPGAFGQTIATHTNHWPSASVWQFRPEPALTGHHYGFWMEPLSGGGYRFWQTFGVDYPGVGFQQLTEAVAACTLNANGTVSNYRSSFGFQGVSQRCVMGRVQKTPAWMQSQYSVGPYLYGFGGYSSLMNQAGVVSLGLFALAGPDATTYTPAAAYPPAGYANNGADWCVPSTDFKILADHRSGATQQNYNPTTGDRGVRLNPVTNYYDGGQNTRVPAGTGTFTQGSTAVMFSQPQTLNAGDWIGPASGGPLAGTAGQTVAAAVTNSTTATLTTAYPGATVTTSYYVFVSPPAPPVSSGHWISPFADGLNRWPWGDSYFATGNVIDGPNKQGLVCVLSGARGRAWYHSPGNFLGADAGVGEIHVFDLNDLGKVAQGQKQPWNVQPSAMKDVTGDLTPHGICTGSHGNESNGPTGASYDATTGILWVFSPGVDKAFGGSGYNCLLSAYQVAS